MSEDWKRDRVGAALRDENPTVLARLDAGFAVIGDVQFLPGYCVFITDTPRVDRLTDLPRERWRDPLPRTVLGPQHDDLRAELTAEIATLRTTG